MFSKPIPNNTLYATHRNKTEGIATHHDIHSFLKSISFDSWVILDIDDTIFEATSEVGGTEWGEELRNIAHNKFHYTKEEASRVATVLDDNVKFITQVRPVENKIVLIIKALQEIGFPILGLTARDRYIQPLTENRLKGIDIDFSKSNSYWGKDDLTLTIPNQIREIYYHQSILYCDENSKGECLKAFLAARKLTPKHVVMVDDKLKNLLQIQEKMQENNHLFFGSHYTRALDNRVKPFPMHKALEQLAKIQHLLPDEAQNIIKALQLTDFTNPETPKENCRP